MALVDRQTDRHSTDVKRLVKAIRTEVRGRQRCPAEIAAGKGLNRCLGDLDTFLLSKRQQQRCMPFYVEVQVADPMASSTGSGAVMLEATACACVYSTESLSGSSGRRS